MTDRAKPPRRRESGEERRSELTETARVELRGATARSAPAAGLLVSFDVSTLAQLQLELLPPDYYFG